MKILIISLIIQLIKYFKISVETFDKRNLSVFYAPVYQGSNFPPIEFTTGNEWDDTPIAKTNIKGLAGKQRVQKIGKNTFVNGIPVEGY